MGFEAIELGVMHAVFRRVCLVAASSAADVGAVIPTRARDEDGAR